MREPAQQHDPPHPGVPSANDRFKAQWTDRLGWSMVAAVAAHLALIVFWPAWVGSDPPVNDSVEPEPMEWIFLRQVPPGGRAAIAAPPAAAGNGADSAAADPAADATSESPEELAALSATLRDRLLRGDGPAPTIAEPEPEPPVDEPPASEDDSTVIGGDASTAEVPDLPEESPLDLDRLSSLRPGLALGSASNWVLIRNPTEVERFMQRVSRRPDVNAGTDASVSVTLWIDERGSVEWAEVSESSGRSELDEVALALFNEVAAFRPARSAGRGVPKSVIFTVHFPW